MNITLYISLTLSGLLALVLSEIMTFPVSAVRTGLTWFGYGMWAVAAAMNWPAVLYRVGLPSTRPIQIVPVRMVPNIGRYVGLPLPVVLRG